MAPVVNSSVRSLTKRASIKPLTPTSLALIMVGSLMVISMVVVGYVFYRKRPVQPSDNGPPKPDDRSSSNASEQHQMQPTRDSELGAPVTVTDGSQDYRYSAGIVSRMPRESRSPRMPRSPAHNRYSVGMLSITPIDPSVSSPNRGRSRPRSGADQDRAYARTSMGIMSRKSMGTRSPGLRNPLSPQDPLLSAGIMSRASMGPVSPIHRPAHAAPSPALAGGSNFLEPPPRYS